MTNGEKIQTILDIDKDCTEVYGKNGMMTFSVPQDWWNAEYEEPITKNDLGVASELEKNSKLEKIRDQLKSHLRGVEITLEVLVENDPLRPKMEVAKTTLEDCLELIDKAEAESI